MVSWSYYTFHFIYPDSLPYPIVVGGKLLLLTNKLTLLGCEINETYVRSRV